MAKKTKSSRNRGSQRGEVARDENFKKPKTKNPKFLEASETRSSSDTRNFGYKPANDPEWLMNDPVLSRNVGTLNFSEPVGATRNVSHTLTSTGTGSYGTLQTAGIMVLEAVPMYGLGENEGSAINIAGTSLYNLLNVHFRVSTNGYTAGDLSMHIMVYDSILCMIWEAQRAYAACCKFSTVNQFVGKALTEACGFDYADLKLHLAQFRANLNTIIQRLAVFKMPDIFKIMDRHKSMYQHIYKDQPTTDPKCQLYVIRQGGYWKYNDATGSMQFFLPTDQKTAPKDQAWIWTTDTWYETASSMVDQLLTSDYINKMVGDIKRVFESDSMLVNVQPIDDFVDIDFTYDPLMQMQFQNAEFFNLALPTDETGTIYPTTKFSKMVGANSDWALDIKYEAKIGTRVDLVGSTVEAKSTVVSGNNLYHLPCWAVTGLSGSDSSSGMHLFNILQPVEKDSATILEVSHYKPSASISLGSSVSTLTITGVQDGLIRQVFIMSYTGNSSQSYSTGGDLICYPIVPLTLLSISSSSGSTVPSAIEARIRTFALLWQFSCPPIVGIARRTDSTGSAAYFYNFVTELQDWYWASDDEVKRMNDVCIKSLFAAQILNTFKVPKG